MANHDELEFLLRRKLERSRDANSSRYKALAEAAKGSSRVETNDASLVSSDGASLAAGVYAIDLTTGDVLIGGTFGTIAALTDQDLLVDVEACQLDGSDPVQIDDGNDVVVALCAVIVNDVPALVAVFGDQAESGSAVAPTPAECRRAMELAEITNHLASGLGIIVGTITIDRDDGGAGTTMTHSDPSSDDDVKGRRLAGALA